MPNTSQIIEKIIKEDEINVLNIDMLRASSIIHRVVDVMGTDLQSSSNEYIWDNESVEEDNGSTIIKVSSFEVGRYIRRTDFNPSFSAEITNEAIEVVSTRSFFSVLTESTIPVSTSANPSIITGYQLVNSRNFELDLVTNSIKNVTGRDLYCTIGSMSLQVVKTGGGTAVLNIYSEVSTDGITWTPNPKNLRKIFINHDGNDFITIPSFMMNWENNSKVRFRVFFTGTGPVTIQPVQESVNGTTLVGISGCWHMEENR